jgi:hypothetical protein
VAGAEVLDRKSEIGIVLGGVDSTKVNVRSRQGRGAWLATLVIGRSGSAAADNDSPERTELGEEVATMH